MTKTHIVATTDYGLVTLTADRVGYADTGALLFFSLVSERGDEALTATFAPGDWRLHFNPPDENSKIVLLEYLGFANKASRDANRVDDPA